MHGPIPDPRVATVRQITTDTAGRRRRRAGAGLGVLAVTLVGCVVLSIGIGAVPITPLEALSILATPLGFEPLTGHTPVQELVLWSIRLPRTVLGLLVGGVLAVSGAVLQGLFRNPLADPVLIGISNGAALAAAVVIVLWGVLPFATAGIGRDVALPVSAFAGALVAIALVYRIASHDGRADIATMLLAGVALTAMAGAGIGTLVFMSDDQALRDLNFWLLGSLGGANWERLMIAGPLMLGAGLAALALARPLNGLLFGETEALHMGFDVERTKRIAVLVTALAVGAAVALSGVIGFVGLMVPHLVRMVLGPDHRVLLPAALMGGGALMLLADLVARTIVLPAELPIGIVTSCVGGPFFLWLLLRRRALGLW
ncbi:iron ABC transporter permease [Roseospira marina]|uniref:Iron ABC transporter permease n=1 Tax=Roseospira marina TaxID=140057 RepID=A0A5M6IDR7_9PROT|nr:iron chelate uptake ABC transporter family permease subunit [Roseospira marina]KAA5606430.1 iron ABC transporter permease [Roseospira marina]MBB4314156.1 iron complex transport system permease protein [Roseospira marina]MBB5087317.1 iron complex transport system permease protein [Roseospira marina]